MLYPNYYPILDLFRSGYIDNRFFGCYGLFDKNGFIWGTSLNDTMFYLRSLFKPIQASILAGFSDKFTNEELAVIQGSHTGEKSHIKLVGAILKKFGLSENDLLCPCILPLNTKNFSYDNISKLHNNCSGKHSMMLAWSVLNGFDTKNYIDFSHPVQLKIKEKLLDYAETNNCIETKDGCLAPVYGLKMTDIARAFLNYYADKNNEKLINAFRENPYLIGGADNNGIRTDTKIMNLSSKLVSKVGAGGFIYVYNIETKQILILKMAQNNNDVREITVMEILYRLSWLKDRFYDDLYYTEDNSPIGKYVFNNSMTGVYN